MTTTAPMADLNDLVDRQSIRQTLIIKGKAVADAVPFGSVMGGLFWGSLTGISGLLVAEFVMLGGPIGWLLAVFYGCLTIFDAFMFFSSIVNNSIFGW